MVVDNRIIGNIMYYVFVSYVLSYLFIGICWSGIRIRLIDVGYRRI